MPYGQFRAPHDTHELLLGRCVLSLGNRTSRNVLSFSTDCAVAKQHRKNKRPQRREAGAKYCASVEPDRRTHTRDTPSSPEDGAGSTQSVHPASLRSSGLFVTLCAITDDAVCFYRLKRLHSPRFRLVAPKILEPPLTQFRLASGIAEYHDGRASPELPACRGRRWRARSRKRVEACECEP